MDTTALADRTAVITGGAQGIGFAVAQRLIGMGARVCLWDADGPGAEQAARDLGASADALAVDVTDCDAVAKAAADTLARHKRIDILVHSAGIAGPNAPLDAYEPADWRKVIDINLNGTFYVNRAVVPAMKAQNYGRIVNIASVAGKEGNPNASAYSASKAGVIALTKSLGKELAGMDIAVNCVTPAAARTRIFDQMTKEFVAFMLSKIPRNRFVEVEEIAAMIGWMVSAENSFTTGAVFDISGGRATY